MFQNWKIYLFLTVLSVLISLLCHAALSLQPQVLRVEYQKGISLSKDSFSSDILFCVHCVDILPNSDYDLLLEEKHFGTSTRLYLKKKYRPEDVKKLSDGFFLRLSGSTFFFGHLHSQPRLEAEINIFFGPCFFSQSGVFLYDPWYNGCRVFLSVRRNCSAANRESVDCITD